MIRTIAMAATCAALLSLSCSVTLQDSVRSSSVDCSTSRGYYVADFLIAASAAGAAATAPGLPSEARAAGFVDTAVFGASALYGVYKRNRCMRWRDTAPREEWERIANLHQQEAEQRAAQVAGWRQQLEQQAVAEAEAQVQTIPQDDAASEDVSAPDAPAQVAAAPTGFRPHVTVTHPVCASGDHCPGGVCYANACREPCGVGDTCPAGHRCVKVSPHGPWGNKDARLCL
jgi:hypothetical protein